MMTPSTTLARGVSQCPARVDAGRSGRSFRARARPAPTPSVTTRMRGLGRSEDRRPETAPITLLSRGRPQGHSAFSRLEAVVGPHKNAFDHWRTHKRDEEGGVE